MILGEGATKEAVEELREEMGWNDPVLVQYGRYMVNVLTKGDFGTSYISKVPVTHELAERLPNTIKLAIRLCGTYGNAGYSDRHFVGSQAVQHR